MRHNCPERLFSSLAGLEPDATLGLLHPSEHQPIADALHELHAGGEASSTNSVEAEHLSVERADVVEGKIELPRLEAWPTISFGLAHEYRNLPRMKHEAA
jgi:hypothetical protein